MRARAPSNAAVATDGFGLLFALRRRREGEGEGECELWVRCTRSKMDGQHESASFTSKMILYDRENVEVKKSRSLFIYTFQFGPSAKPQGQ